MKLDFHREKRKISLIAFDLDGTLLNSSLQISEFTLSRIRAIAGRKVKITVCSGRIPAFQRLYLAQLDLDGPYVACNGALIPVTLTVTTSVPNRLRRNNWSGSMLSLGRKGCMPLSRPGIRCI